ncbi:MAG: DEAD/DEAH box helicase [Candidatus Ancillula sp.]|jgi:transcription-repair coupling factor|nr:DEAD/DEAH box helicase [Candidatus Ancillula sp.]
MKESKINVTAKLLDVFSRMRAYDGDFSKTIEEVGLTRGFHLGLTIRCPTSMCKPFLMNQALFRPVYVMENGSLPLKLSKYMIHFTDFDEKCLKVQVGDNISLDYFISRLVACGYERSSMPHSVGVFSVIGGKVDVNCITENDEKHSVVVSLDFFGDEIDEIRFMKSARIVEEVKFLPLVQKSMPETQLALDVDKIQKNALVAIINPQVFDMQVNEEFVEFLGVLHANNITAVSMLSFGDTKYTLRATSSKLLEEFENLDTYKTAPENDEDKKLVENTFDVKSLIPGDLVVHDLHGIGRFLKTEVRKSYDQEGDDEEYLVIEYASSSRKSKHMDYLFVPTSSPKHLTKYIGSANAKLSRFGGGDFAKLKNKTKRYAEFSAKKLVALYAQRLKKTGIAFDEDDDAMHQLEDSFEWELTPDQKTAIEDVKRDMCAISPMDRLICADVGFGKTEIAIRAAFKAVSSGYQVAVLVPTTILASQHFDTFTNRFKEFPVEVRLLSRFTSTSQQKDIFQTLANGRVDVVIGTHMIFSKQIDYKNLGLIVIDEEQRFGTMHKEKLKLLRPNADVLMMSATPIPRTLEMALTGIRDISMLRTPPKNRIPIITNVLEYSDQVLVDAISFEVARAGQVFIVHNNTSTIQARAEHIAKLVPDATIAVAHGQMSQVRLDHVINDFWLKKIDILISTTIIETGMDIANANTLIVESADKYGLTQLHQLRGRVGRSQIQAYAYLFYKHGSSITTSALKRLETIQNLNQLGDGTSIAVKDLQMRGAGDFLGAEQSGYVNGVGHEMYVRIMTNAISSEKKSLLD